MLMSRIAKALRRVLGLYTEAEVQQYIDRAREEGRLDEQDRLAFELFERGGFATLQLNPNPTHIPRIRFVDPSKTQPVAGVRLDHHVAWRRHQDDGCGHLNLRGKQ